MGLRRLAISNPLADTDTTLFTADNQYLLSVIAANKSASATASLTVWVQPSGSSTASEYAYIISNLTIEGANSYETFRFAVNQNDEVHIQTDSADLSLQAYGLVQYDVNLGVGISSFQSASPTNVTDGLIWVDSDGVLSGTSAKPAYVWSSASSTWIPFAGELDTSANYTFTGTVVIPGYEKEIPLQNSAPSSPSSSDLWIDNTIPLAPILKVYDGSNWITAGSTGGEDTDSFFLMGS